MQDLHGKVAVVTGGASGIGYALARRFASEGARVVIGDVEAAALDRAVSGLRDSGAGISARHFVEHALFPTLKMLGTSRAELKAVALPAIPTFAEPLYAAK